MSSDTTSQNHVGQSDGVPEVTNAIKNISVEDKNDQQLNSSTTENSPSENEEKFWGFNLHEAYSMAVKFYKDNEGKQTFSLLSYEDKLHLAALTKQVSHGPFSEQKNLPEIGYLDMFGHDRRRIWESLQDMSSNNARRNFLKSLEKAVPIFGPFMDAHQRQREEEIRLKNEEIKRKKEEERLRLLEEQRQREAAAKAEEDRTRQDQERIQIEQKRQIMAALNAQTSAQFQQYAAQQFPGNSEQQAALIAQLQEQHYQQYIQLYIKQQQQQQQQQQTQPQQAIPPTDINTTTPSLPSPTQQNGETPQAEQTSNSEEDSIKICEPSLWTRPQIDEFKQQIKKDPESVLTVGRGEVVTVRVPTHEEGAYIFWEFATDYYDLGFGVYFEWTDAASNDVTVHVNESSDEEGSDLDEYPEYTGDDVEKAPGGGSNKQQPLADEIVPVYRRESHTQVHAGSHRYPGRGIYLLKFDNSYSLWRSKTLYYRVYYTR